jgi:hypothetical protein
MKNHHFVRLTRWVLKLSEYDFETEYKAGKKHVNADCLSGNIASVAMETGTLKSQDDESDDALIHITVFT